MRTADAMPASAYHQPAQKGSNDFPRPTAGLGSLPVVSDQPTDNTDHGCTATDHSLATRHFPATFPKG